MTLCVLDASLALELVFPRPGHDFSAVLDRLRDEGGLVPEVWHLEVVNVALKTERRDRLPAAIVDAAIGQALAFVAETDLMSAMDVGALLAPLARAERISLFDAAYLDLAARTGLPLATLDGGLAGAALRRGIPLLPLTP